MRKIIFISFLATLFFSFAHAQENKYVYKDSTLIKDTEAKVEEKIEEIEPSTKLSDTLFIDTTLIYNNIKVSADSVKAWKNLNSFAYVKYLDSLLKNKQQKDKNNKSNSKESDNYSPSGASWLDKLLSSSVLQFILWAAAISFVFFVLYKLFLTEGIFRKKTAASNTNTPEVNEEIITADSNFEALISQAKKNSNYRLAVRYLYLQCLHNLAGKKVIELAVDKTNFQYVSELKNKNLQQDFASLTLHYEYVWYGQFTIDENRYYKMEKAFNNFTVKS